MKKNMGMQLLVIIAAVLGLGGYAFAHGGGMMGGGMGGPGMMGSGSGYGYGMGGQGQGYYGRQMGNNGYGGNLSQQDAARLQQARNRFDASTRRLRNDIRDKQAALNDEMNKTEPDAGSVSRLQNQLSRLRSEYDRKALAFQIEMRNIVPNGTNDRNTTPDNGYRR